MDGLDLAAAQEIADQLLDAWSAVEGGHRRETIHQASLDAVEEEQPPPPGLAVGHVIDGDGRARIGVRATARGKRLRAARSLVADIERQGVPIDFRIIPQPEIVSGQLDEGSGLGACFTEHLRPLCLGCSVSHENGPAGTLGAFVRRQGQIGILSCCHVLALGGDASEGDFVCQPARRDLQQMLGEHRVGTLSGTFTPLVPSLPKGPRVENPLDAAMAFLTKAEYGDGNCIPCNDIVGERAIPADLKGKPIGKVGVAAALPRGARLAKIGRSSGYTEGILSMSNLRSFTPILERKKARNTYIFPNVIEVESLSAATPFARGGDSGALVFTLPDRVPIGLHFCSVPLAGQPSLNYLMPLERICAMLALEVL